MPLVSSLRRTCCAALCGLIFAATLPGAAPAIERASFGRTPAGAEVEQFTLVNGQGASAKIITYGAIVADLRIPDRTGRTVGVVREITASPAGFERGFAQSAAVFGRVANRIALARFELDGETYQVTPNMGRHHIHGGRLNFSRVVWTPSPVVTPDGPALELRYRSPHGEEGFPGNLDVTVTYTLTLSNTLRVEYTATTDRPTPVNLTNHAFFNLAGTGDVLDHEVTVNAELYTGAGESLIPNGEIRTVRNTALDFTSPRALGARVAQLPANQRYDHNFVLKRPGGAPSLAFAARVLEPKSGRTMEVWTTLPGVQFYTSPLGAAAAAGRFGFYCLETQHFPDSVNHAHFPSTIVRPGSPYRSITEFRFGQR
ncbi:MAG: hypothetical protein B9S34_01085 [Opitutia bacterium Tous-C1TDCM]|nr:MAG: hypothetical protein B9S34_01085 [Opitutae bacterium Tous-C1TDCM]